MPQIIDVPGHGHVEFPDGMSDDQIVAAIKANSAPAAPERSIPDSIARQLGLTARAAISGVAALPNMVADPVVSGINAMGGNLPIPSQALERTMTRAGLPEPGSGTERFANQVVQGMAQPGLMAKMIPSMASRIGTQIAAAGAGAGGSELAQEAGAGPMGQMAAGLGAGIAAPASILATGAAARAGGRLVGNLTAPMTEAGRKDIAARILQGAASDPEAAAANIANAPRYVPGVTPLTAEVANDSGVSAISKNIRNQSPAAFADAEAANDAARQAALQRSFGNATNLTMAEQARDEIGKKLRDAAFADAKPVDVRPIVNSASTIAKSGAGKRQEVEKAMAWVKSRLQGEKDPERIYAVRQDINDIIDGKMARDPEKASFQLAAGQLSAIRSILDAQLEKSAPGFKQYLTDYFSRSRPIDAMRTGQEIAASAVNPMTEKLSPAIFARQMNNRAEDVAGMGAIGSDALSRMNADLKRSVAPSAAMRTAGSDTLQNMVGNELLQRALGNIPGGPVSRIAGKAASVLYTPFEQQTRGLLAQSMIDPELAMGLLRRELKKRPDLMRGLLDARGPVSRGGLLGAMSAQ